MLFMVIERFREQNPIPVYRRVRDLLRRGRVHGDRRGLRGANVGVVELAVGQDSIGLAALVTLALRSRGAGADQGENEDDSTHRGTL